MLMLMNEVASDWLCLIDRQGDDFGLQVQLQCMKWVLASDAEVLNSGAWDCTSSGDSTTRSSFVSDSSLLLRKLTLGS